MTLLIKLLTIIVTPPFPDLAVAHRAATTRQGFAMTHPHFSRTQLRRAVLSSYLGSVIEYYDFLLYATASALVFHKVFFPNLDPLVGTVAASARSPSATSPVRSAGSCSATSATGSAARRCWCSA